MLFCGKTIYTISYRRVPIPDFSVERLYEFAYIRFLQLYILFGIYLLRAVADFYLILHFSILLSYVIVRQLLKIGELAPADGDSRRGMLG